MKMIVGLGNIGKEYARTRHNVGFMVLDSFGKEFTLEKKFQAYVRVECIQGEKCLFVKPTTFMNLSGLAVAKLSRYYNIDPSDILVIQDDMDLNFGRQRLKIDSSSGGHNGIKSIIDSLGTTHFARLKIGISHDLKGDTVQYVLGNFSKEEMAFLSQHFSFYQEIIYFFIENGIEKTMKRYNSK